MTDTQLFFIEIMRLVPNNSFCEVRSSHDDLIGIVKTMNDNTIQNAYECKFTLTDVNKQLLVNAVKERHIEEYIHSLEIEFEGKQVFVAFDGFEIGMVSNKISLPALFIQQFVNNKHCVIADNW